MHVVATAGHVDHGKSTLVRALTGQDPDRLGEEHRRGLSIVLGYCWTELPDVGEVAFVDVPGHERFVPTMLAGVGPVPAVLFVVAADDPWMPQAAEHLAALHALGVRHGVVAISRSDLADPEPARQRVREHLAGTTLQHASVVSVSAATGHGIPDLVDALTAMVGRLGQPDPTADVRLWVDRRFHVKGAGTVVTGTLPAGRITPGDTLQTADHSVRVRGAQTLGRDVSSVVGTARVALNLGGDVPEELQHGSVLVTPDAFELCSTVDVRIDGPESVPLQSVLHIGAATVGVRHRPLGAGLARLSLQRALPLRIGDRALLRDPGSRRIWGMTVLDPQPSPLRRRGDAGRRARLLVSASGTPDPADEVRRRGVVAVSTLRRLGVDTGDGQPPPAAIRADGWLVDQHLAERLGRRVADAVAEHDRTNPLQPGLPVAAATRDLGLPSDEVLQAVLPDGFAIRAGRVTAAAAGPALPAEVRQAVDVIRTELTDRPFAAPEGDRLRRLGLDPKAAAAAARAGLLLRLADGVLLLPDADQEAVRRLAALPQPFTASEARRALDTSRRVVLPLLAHLDRAGFTRRLPDDRRTVASTSTPR